MSHFLLKAKIFKGNLGKTFETFIRILFFSTWRNALKSLTKTNGTCVILGNGPSLTDSLERYKNQLAVHDMVAVNSFACTDFFTEIEPRFYIMNAKVLFWPDERISQFYIDLRNDIFSSMKNKISWDMYLMVPFQAKKSKEFQGLLQSNPLIHPLYFNQNAAEGFKFFKHFLFRRKLGMPRPHNVLIPSIINMINLGYKEIYLIGADHSWLAEISVNENNEAFVHQKHFYDENTSKPTKMEDRGVRPRRLHEILDKFYLTFKGYWEIAEYAEKSRVKIYNASEVSMIDAFERRKLD